jgi:hypothetical protein
MVGRLCCVPQTKGIAPHELEERHRRIAELEARVREIPDGVSMGTAQDKGKVRSVVDCANHVHLWCEYPSDNTIPRKSEVTDAFGTSFHADIIDKYSGVNDINASYYYYFLSLLFGRLL